MLSLFRLYDPARIILLLILLVLIRLPFWLNGVPIAVTGFQNVILGEALANGRLVYLDVWHFAGPLSAWVFQLIGEVVGRSVLTYNILGTFLLFFQALYFNNMLNRSDAMKDRGLTPALFYIFFGSLFFELFGLGPELLALFPVLYAIEHITIQVRFGGDDKYFFRIGFAIAVAALFASQFIWLMLFVTIYIPFAFVMTTKRFALLFSGFTAPFLFALFYFFMREAHHSLWDLYFNEIFKSYYSNYLSLPQYILIFVIPFLMTLVGMVQVFFRSRFLNYQESFQYFFLLLGVIAIPTVLFSKELSIRSFYLFIPFFSFWAANLYLSLRLKAINEFIFTTLLILTVFVNYGFTYQKFFNPETSNMTSLIVEKSERSHSDFTMLNLSNDYAKFVYHPYAGPALFFPYTLKYLEGQASHQKRIFLHHVFTKENPDIIIDPYAHFAKIAYKDYYLRNQYEVQRPGVFSKKALN